MSWMNICEVSKVSVAQPFHVKIDGLAIGVYKIDDAFYALEDVCPHAYALLTQGFVEDGMVECPLHEAVFDIKTGAFLKGPECRHLNKYEIKQEGKDLYILLED